MTLHLFSKFARRTQPRGDAGTSAPVEYPSSSMGALSNDEMYARAMRLWHTRVQDGYYERRDTSQSALPLNARVLDAGGGTVNLLVDRDTREYPAWGQHVTISQFVEGDGPLESGLTPSPSIDTDRLNKLLIEAAATMREQNDLFAAINTALDRHIGGTIGAYSTLATINRLMGRQ